jgi:hypothetical protein
MAIGSGVIALLSWLKQSGYLPPSPAVVELGAQQLANTFLRAGPEMDDLGRIFGCQRPFEMPPPRPSHVGDGQAELLDAEAPFARDFWIWLGFEYAAIDIDGSPGSIPLDLNYDGVPRSAIRKYHLVTNFGTTEHVANQLNAFKIIHDLTVPGGVMVHHLPAQGMANHGLVNYNAKFFWLLARSNGYHVLDFDFFASATSYELPENLRDYAASFRPDLRDRMKNYKLTDAGLLVVLQKAYDIPFVAPIDVQTGTRTHNERMEKRYWTVFRPDVFFHLPRSHLRVPDRSTPAWSSRLVGWLRTPPLELSKKVIRRLRRIMM